MYGEKKESFEVKGEYFEECGIEEELISEEHLDKEILQKFTSIREAFKNQPVRRLPNNNY